MLDNQTPEFFQDVNKPKYNGTLNLDRWAPPFSSPSFSLHGPHTGDLETWPWASAGV